MPTSLSIGSALPHDRQRPGDWSNHIEIVWRDPYATSGYSQAALMPDGRVGRRASHKITTEFPRDRFVIVKACGVEAHHLPHAGRSLAEYYAIEVNIPVRSGYYGDLTTAAQMVRDAEAVMAHMPTATPDHVRAGPVGLVLAAATLPCPACDQSPPRSDSASCTEYGDLTVKIPPGSVWRPSPLLDANIAAEWNAGNANALTIISDLIAVS